MLLYNMTRMSAPGALMHGHEFDAVPCQCVTDAFNDAEEVKLELRPKNAVANSSSGSPDGSTPAAPPALAPGSAAVASFKARGIGAAQGLRLRTTKASHGTGSDVCTVTEALTTCMARGCAHAVLLFLSSSVSP
jgi:hypothetical protein